MDLLDLRDSQLQDLIDILRAYPKLKTLELLDKAKEEQKRRQTPQLQGQEIIDKFLLKYVRLNLCDGLGSYEVWKVKRLDVDDTRKIYFLYPDSPGVSNVDGDYSIDTYLEEVTIETDSDLKKLTVITKEEYDLEFQKALDYYKNLKKDE